MCHLLPVRSDMEDLLSNLLQQSAASISVDEFRLMMRQDGGGEKARGRRIDGIM